MLGSHLRHILGYLYFVTCYLKFVVGNLNSVSLVVKKKWIQQIGNELQGINNESSINWKCHILGTLALSVSKQSKKSIKHCRALDHAADLLGSRGRDKKWFSYYEKYLLIKKVVKLWQSFLYSYTYYIYILYRVFIKYCVFP